LVIAGLLFSVLPPIPGPILGYLSLLLVSLAAGWSVYSPALLVVLAVLVLGVTILDGLLPVWSAGRAGAGRAGVWGSVVGMIVGSFFIPPFGTIIGAFLGALLGELLLHRENRRPLKAAVGVFSGTMLATVLKLAAAGVAGVYFVRGVARAFAAL
jgi:hypothetical protein